MTNEQRETITHMQRIGKGYRTIASETGLSVNSVKSWCRRHPIEVERKDRCKQCGSALVQIPGKRTRLFCSDQCRLRWWATHPECRGHRVTYVHTCRFCGKVFTNNRVKADYCGRACFAKTRMKVATDE